MSKLDTMTDDEFEAKLRPVAHAESDTGIIIVYAVMTFFGFAVGFAVRAVFWAG